MKIVLSRMICNVQSIWIISVLLINVLKPVTLQFGVPVYPPPMFPVPAPIVPLPGPIIAPDFASSSSSSSEEKKTTTSTITTTTTTTKKPKKKKCKMVFPAFPSFNCNSGKRRPVPIPPIIAPQPLVLVPVPPAIPARPIQQRQRQIKKLIPIYSSSEEFPDSSSSYDFSRKRRHRKRRRQNIYRRSLRSSESDNELLKPMLRYVADNGDVKFETKINNDDVAKLLGKKQKVNKILQTVQVLTNKDETDKRQVIVISNNEEMRRNKPERYKKVLLRGGATKHVLSDGKKELIFRPPADKKISNLSVSFQIS